MDLEDEFKEITELVDKQLTQHRFDFMMKGLKSVYQGMHVSIPEEKCLLFAMMINNLIISCNIDEIDPAWEAQYDEVMNVIDSYHLISGFKLEQVKKFHEHLDDLLEEASSEGIMFAKIDLATNIPSES